MIQGQNGGNSGNGGSWEMEDRGMPLTMTRPRPVDVREYEDYRRFLKDRFDELHGLDAAFSQRMLARKAGFANPGFFNEVIKGRRKLSPAATAKMIAGLSMEPAVAECFTVMVEYNDSKDAIVRQSASQRLSAYRNQGGHDSHEAEQSDQAYPIERASFGLDIHSDENGHVSSAMFSVSEGTYRRILDRLVDFRGQVQEMVESDVQMDMRDVQFNLQMLPRSSVVKGGN
jgi:hypothetical protein